LEAQPRLDSGLRRNDDLLQITFFRLRGCSPASMAVEYENRTSNSFRGAIMPIEIYEKEFEKEVRQSEKPVLVYFHLPSCAKCVTWNNVAEGLVKDTEGKVRLVKLNVADNQGLAKALNIQSAPSFLVYRDGLEVERFVGDRVNYEEIFGYFQNLAGTD
jgi:thioredoxin 1